MESRLFLTRFGGPLCRKLRMTHPNNADKKQRHVFLSDAKTTCCQVPSIMERDSESNGYDRPRRYENEDVTPTSDRELKGWYAYGLAAEVFAVAGVGKYVYFVNASTSLTNV